MMHAKQAIHAGQLDRCVDLLTPTTIVDAVGGQSVTWTKAASVWASRNDARGRESFGAGEQAEWDRQYRMRDPGVAITGSMRLRDGGVDFDIRHVSEMGRGRGYELTVREVDRAGVS